jgi:hypothetical protein
MNAPLSRVVLDVHDVERLSAFYQDAFALSVVEHIKSETSDLQNSGVPEFCHCQFAQVGNIRLAHSGVPEFWNFWMDTNRKYPICAVKPGGRLFPDDTLGDAGR